MQSPSVQQSLNNQEISFEVSGFSNQTGLDVILTLDPELLLCPNCAKNNTKSEKNKPTTTTPTSSESPPTSVCPDCLKAEKIWETQADTVLQVTSEFLEQLDRTKQKLVEAEKLASKYLETRETRDHNNNTQKVPSSGASSSAPTFYRSVSSLYIYPPEEDRPDSPGTPDSAFYGSEFSRPPSTLPSSSPAPPRDYVTNKTIYVSGEAEEDPSVDLGNLRTLSKDLSGENTDLCDELEETKLKINDLRKISNLLKLSLQGELVPDPFDVTKGSDGYSCDACSAEGHIHCVPQHRLKQLMRIVLNNFEATIMEMLETNKHLFVNLKTKYRDEVEEKPEIAFVSHKEVWSLFSKLSETMQGITCSVLYLVSRALDTWMLFSWGFIAWAWPTLVVIAKSLLEKLYPRVSAIKAFVSSEAFCAFAAKWNEGHSLATCFKELENEAFLSTVCRISVSFVSVYMALPVY